MSRLPEVTSASCESRYDDVQRLQCNLRALRHSNRALIRATDEPDYLREVCGIIVEDCGYSMVWVGCALRDPGKTVKPVAWAGFEAGYLEKLEVTWADTERGRGPAGTAIRTGRPVVSHDVLTDPQFAPWREEAARRGYTSAISLPLFSEAAVIGVINIYAERPNAFSEETVPVLRDLAEDVGYGIGTLRLRKAHDLAQAQVESLARFFKRLGDNSPDVIVRLDLKLRHVYVNPAIEKVTGIRPERYLGKTNEELGMPGEFCALWNHHFQQVLRQGQSGRFQFCFHAIDGCEHCFDMMLVPEFDPAGQVQSGLGIARDITEQLDAQKAVRESESKFRHIFDAANEGIWLLDAEARVTLVNGKMAQLLGYAPEEIRGRRKTDFVPQADLPAVEALLARRRAGISEEADMRFRRKNGEVVWALMSGRALLDDAGKFIGILDMITDITARKRAEDALRESEERFRLMADGTPVLIWVHDQAGRLQFVNLAYCEFFGVTIEQVRDKAWQPLVHPDDLPGYARGFTECHRERRAFQAQARMRRNDGQWRWIESNAVPRWSSGGEFLGLAGSSTDITERKAFQAELERLVAERTAALQEMTDQLNGFVQTLAHDFRAPLRTQTGLAQLLLSEHGHKLGEGTHLAESLARSAERQMSLIQDLMAHVNLSRADLPLQPVSMAAVLDEVRADLALEFQRTQALLKVVGLDRFSVIANRATLHLVLQNFLTNALKFIPEGTPPAITVRAELRKHETVPGSASPKRDADPATSETGEMVRLWVEDNGLGIRTEDLSSVFGWFQRFHPSIPGSGLGLALVKKAAERMGGGVGVESTPGHGSRFWLDLRLAGLVLEG